MVELLHVEAEWEAGPVSRTVSVQVLVELHLHLRLGQVYVTRSVSVELTHDAFALHAHTLHRRVHRHVARVQAHLLARHVLVVAASLSLPSFLFFTYTCLLLFKLIADWN